MENMLVLHKRVEDSLEKLRSGLPQLEAQIGDLDSILSAPNGLSRATEGDLRNTIDDLRSQRDALLRWLDRLPFYRLDFQALTQTQTGAPVKKVSFMSMPVRSGGPPSPRAAPSEVLAKYLGLVKKYGYEVLLARVEESKSKKEAIVDQGSPRADPPCEGCGSGRWVLDHTSKICEGCGREHDVFESAPLPANKFNGVRYSYERRIHFKECMCQVQGKQNITIKAEIYRSIERQLGLYGLLGTGRRRFAAVKLEHVVMVLKELSLTKYNENCLLIFHNLTGKPIYNFPHLEMALMDDFDVFVKRYDEMTVSRSLT